MIVALVRFRWFVLKTSSSLSSGLVIYNSYPKLFLLQNLPSSIKDTQKFLRLIEHPDRSFWLDNIFDGRCEVTPSLYFYRSYNRYREHNDTIGNSDMILWVLINRENSVGSFSANNIICFLPSKQSEIEREWQNASKKYLDITRELNTLLNR